MVLSSSLAHNALWSCVRAENRSTKAGQMYKGFLNTQMLSFAHQPPDTKPVLAVVFILCQLYILIQVDYLRKVRYQKVFQTA